MMKHPICNSVQSAKKEWASSFHFLRETPLCYAYLNIMGMAKSVNYLEKLHKMLPENSRLTMAEWKRIVSFWKKYFFNAEAGFRTELEKWLLEECRVDWKKLQDGDDSPIDATSLYSELIKKQASPEELIYFSYYQNGKLGDLNYPRVLSSVEASGHGDYHFKTLLFGSWIDTSFHLHKDNKFVLVAFMLQEKKLQESFVFQISKQLPPYNCLRFGVSSFSTAKGKFHHIAFEFEMPEIKDNLKPVKKGEEEFVALEKFSSYAADAFRKNGIPAEGDLLPITYEVLREEEETEEV